MESKSHKIVAWYFDVSLMSYLVIAAYAFSIAWREAPYYNPYANIIQASILFLTVCYYKFFVDKVPWLTPGELFAGRTRNDGKKCWINPYFTNRWALFFITITAMSGTGFVWSELWEGHIYSFLEAGILLVAGLMFLYSIIKVGQGVLKWSFIIITLYAFDSTLYIWADETSTPLFIVAKVVYLILMIVTFYSYYYLRKKRVSVD